jgi:hypothetical protein
MTRLDFDALVAGRANSASNTAETERALWKALADSSFGTAISKLDKGAFTGTADDLVASIASKLVDVEFKGSVAPSDVPTGTGKAYWLTAQPGTYPNHGGFTVAVNEVAFFIRDAVGVFSISKTALVIPDSKINPFVNQAYIINSQVSSLGKIWYNTSATAIDEIPGTSGKWDEVLTGYVDRIHNEKASKYVNNGIDAKTAATWINGILRADGSITNAGENYSFYTEEFFEVVPNVSTIDFYGNQSFGSEPIILGYSKDKSTVTIVKSGSGNPAIYKGIVPDSVYYVRFATTQPTATAFVCKIVSKAELTLNVFAKYPKLINKEDPFVGGIFKEHFNADNTASIGNYLGTGFVPVTVGDTISFKGYGVQLINALGGFDSDKVFVRKLIENTEPNKIYEVRLNPETDQNIAFVVGTHYQQGDATTPFLLVRSASTIEEEVKEVSDKKNPKIFGFSNAAIITPLNTDSTVTIENGFTVLNAISGASYWRFEPKTPSSVTHSRYIAEVELELITLPSGTTSVDINLYGSPTWSTKQTFTAVGQVKKIQLFTGVSADKLLYVNSAGVKFKVINVGSGFVENKFFDKYTYQELQKMTKKLDFETLNMGFSDFAFEANTANFVNTQLVGSGYTAFGDSITSGAYGETLEGYQYGYALHVAEYFRMSFNNLGWGGAQIQQILSDTQLAKIPQGTKLVTITAGTNYWEGSAVTDITSRDVNSRIGVLNHAIDYIEQNHPLAIIVLMTPPRNGATPQTVTAYVNLFKDIAVYRGLAVADVDGLINWNVYNMPLLTYDFVHPSNEGCKRIAGVVIGAVNKVVF